MQTNKSNGNVGALVHCAKNVSEICECEQAGCWSWMPETRIISCLVGSPHILHVAREGRRGGGGGIAGRYKVSFFLLLKTTLLIPPPKFNIILILMMLCRSHSLGSLCDAIQWTQCNTMQYNAVSARGSSQISFPCFLPIATNEM